MIDQDSTLWIHYPFNIELLPSTLSAIFTTCIQILVGYKFFTNIHECKFRCTYVSDILYIQSIYVCILSGETWTKSDKTCCVQPFIKCMSHGNNCRYRYS